jgi:hypothetical protein
MKRLLVVCCLAAVLAGCGGSSEESDAEKVASVIRTYSSAMAEKDPEGVCATLTSAAIAREVSRFADDYAQAGEGLLNCPRLYRFAFGLFGRDQIAEAEAIVLAFDASYVDLRGKRTAVVEVGDDIVILKKTGDDWLIDKPSPDKANVAAIEEESRQNLEEVYGDRIYAVHCPEDLTIKVKDLFECVVESPGGNGFVLYYFTDREGHLSLVQYESGIDY